MYAIRCASCDLVIEDENEKLAMTLIKAHVCNEALKIMEVSVDG